MLLLLPLVALAWFASADPFARVALAFVLVASAAGYVACRFCLYRPPEMHAGVVYRLDRVSRILSPEPWSLIIPGLDEVRQPVNLGRRSHRFAYRDVLTSDHVPFNLDVSFHYELDPREVDRSFLPRFLKITYEGHWEAVVGKHFNELVPEVVAGLDSTALLKAAGRRELKARLSYEAARRLEALRLHASEEYGVSLQRLEPTGRIMQAMITAQEAAYLGPATRVRMEDLVKLLAAQGLSATEALAAIRMVNAANGDEGASVTLIPMGSFPMGGISTGGFPMGGGAGRSPIAGRGPDGRADGAPADHDGA